MLGGHIDESTVRLARFLVRVRLMGKDQFQLVMKEKRKHPGRTFGQIAVEKGCIDEDAVNTYFEQMRLLKN
jgi:hypothetical protein